MVRRSLEIAHVGDALKPRSFYLDFVKGLLILLVVWGHAIQFVGYRPVDDWFRSPFWSDPAFKLIYLFHMPLFMGVSGFLCYASIRNSSLASTSLRRFRQLIVPVLCWSIIWPLFQIALSGLRPGATFEFPTLLSMVAQFGGEIVGRFWFLWAVFAGTVLAALARTTRLDRGFGFLLISVLVLLLPDAGILPMLKYTVPFFFAGYLLRHHGIDLLAAARPGRLFALGVLGAASYLAWTPATYVYTSGMQLTLPQIPRILFLYATGALASAGFLFLSHRLFQVWRPDWILSFGRRSLDIYIFQTFIFLLLQGREHPFQNAAYFSITIAPIVALMICFTCVFAGRIIDRLPLAPLALLGRRTPKSPPSLAVSHSVPDSASTRQPVHFAGRR